MSFRGISAVGIFLVAAACTPSASVLDETPNWLALTNTGLTVTRADGPDSGAAATMSEIGFGRTQDSTIAAVSKVINQDPFSVKDLAECGAGPLTQVDWDIGLALLFQDGDFRGWAVTTPRFKTPEGLATGDILEPSFFDRVDVQQTSLGEEYEINGVFGLITEAASGKYTELLWSGVSCFFR